MFEVTPRIRVPLTEFELTFARSGGPGGQNVNKVNSKAILRWDFKNSPSVSGEVKQRFEEQFGSRLTTEGELVLSSQTYRDQISNVEDCYEKLRAMLAAVAERPIQRRATRPTLSSKKRRVEGKRLDSQKKQGRRSPGMMD